MGDMATTSDESRTSRRADRVRRWIEHIVPGAASAEALSADWSVHTAGDLGIALQQVHGGIVVRSLFDLKQWRELLAQQAAPLFSLGLHSGTHELLVSADAGWEQVHVQTLRRGFSLEWSHPLDPELRPLRV